MSLYKRGDTYWTAIWINGVRTMRSLETSNRRQAEMREQRLRDDLQTKRFQLPNFKPEMPFAELYGRFLAEGDVKPHHQDRAKQFLPFFAEMPIGQITKNDIARYRKQRHAEHLRRQTKKKPKRGTPRRHSTMLGEMSAGHVKHPTGLSCLRPRSGLSQPLSWPS